jgi:glycosyltransferase involved in cell wall biosynthesis
LAQSSIALAIDSIANLHLNDNSGTIITFPDETFGLISIISSLECKENMSMPQNNKKSILITISAITGGGAEHVVEHLCNTLDSSKFDIHCGYFKERGERGDALAENGVNVVRLTDHDESKTDYFSFLKMRKYCKDHHIELVHAHDIHAMVNGALMKLTMPRIKLLYTFHFGNYPNIEKNKYYFEKVFSKIPDQLIAVGTRQAKEISRTYNIPERRIKTIYNGVHDISIPKERINNKVNDKFTFGSLSTLTTQKGIEILIESVERLNKKHPNKFSVVVVGDGPLKDELTELCKAKNLEEVIKFTGWVRDANINMLPNFDVFVQSSKWEAMSVVILEAMSAGKPIVATNVGENHIVLENEKSALIVPPNDPQQLADAMERVLFDASLRERLGASARLRFGENYTVEKMAQNYEHLYTSIMA